MGKLQRRQINPWSWQELWLHPGLAGRRRRRRRLPGRTGPISAEGELVGEGDFAAQARQTFENIKTVLEQAGAAMDSLVKLTVYLTDIDELRAYGQVRREFIPGPPPAGTAVQVGALAVPGMMIEVDAVAVL